MRIVLALVAPVVIVAQNQWTPAEKEHFLETARIVSEVPATSGLAHTRKYRLAKLLHLTYMTPVPVARVVDGKPAAVTWWIDGVLMDERERIDRHITPTDVSRWNAQMADIRVFDQLIYNMDRSEENLLIDRNWSAWMIDHTRAFRKWPSLRNPAAVTRCNPEFCGRSKS
jgi:hypothetical protein